MTVPRSLWLDLPAGRFRALEWPGAEPPVLFLHGLTGVAEVWVPTIARLGKGRPRCIALDQRGHGQSQKEARAYTAADFAGDTIAALDALGIERAHLVGHSMGARVAIVAASRHRERFLSVTIVDIGPEAWRANWEDTVAAFDRMPKAWPSLEDATAGAARRGGESIDAALASNDELLEVARARFRTGDGGQVHWWADISALSKTVKTQRSRNYWREWRWLRGPALLIRGGTSRELRPAIAERMRRENPRVRYLEMDGVGHNIPLLAPGRLAAELERSWAAPTDD